MRSTSVIRALRVVGKDCDPFAKGLPAFRRAEAITLRKPSQWPGAESGETRVRLLWNEQHLFLAYELVSGSFAPARTVPPADAGADVGVPQTMRSILYDDRVEIFMWVAKEGMEEAGQHYYAIECNKAGNAIENKVGFRRQFDWAWRSGFRARFCEAQDAENPAMVLQVPWSAYGVDLALHSKNLRIALCRGEFSAPAQIKAGGVWSCHVEPHDKEVDFHRSNCFSGLTLEDASQVAHAKL